MIVLRDYQDDLIDGARGAFREGYKSVLLQLPTGGGKTVTSAVMVRNTVAKGNVAWWLVHRREIINQASATFSSLGIPHGLVMGGAVTDPMARVQIGSIQTVARRLHRLPPPNIIVFDEAHHMGARQYQDVFDAFPDAVKLGFTATPARFDGKGLGNWFQRLIEGPTVSLLIERGALSPYRLFAPATPDLAGVKSLGGDYKRDALSKIMDRPSIVGDAVAHYQRLASGKRAVVFACSIEHSRNIVAQFQSAGITAEHVDGSMDTATRDATIGRFVSGETLILSNVDLFGEGFDVPAIETVIMLRPTQSLSLYLQQVGRGLRPMEGKEAAIILDHAGNSLRHGLPDDDREWSLADRAKKKRAEAAETPVRQCPDCYRVYRPAPKCPGCGHAAPVAARVVEEVEGVLAEIDAAALKREAKREEGSCRTLQDWQALAARRGYSSGWAWHRFNARQRRAA